MQRDTLRFFGGRGWMSRAAHLKKPRRGFFARRTVRRALRVALAAFSAAPWQGFEKAERCPSLASLFPPQAAVGSAAVRIHPPSESDFAAKQKPQRTFIR